MKICLCSASPIKVAAIDNTIKQLNMTRNLNASFDYEPSASGVDNQPVGDANILRGAIGRAINLYAEHIGIKQYDCYIAIENGIMLQGSWYDYAICLAFFPANYTIVWTATEKIHVPSDFVDITRRREGGFKQWTVAQTMFDQGFSDDPSDYHKAIVGIPREVYLRQGLIRLIYSNFDQFQLSGYRLP